MNWGVGELLGWCAELGEMHTASMGMTEWLRSGGALHPLDLDLVSPFEGAGEVVVDL